MLVAKYILFFDMILYSVSYDAFVERLSRVFYSTILFASRDEEFPVEGYNIICFSSKPYNKLLFIHPFYLALCIGTYFIAALPQVSVVTLL